MCAVCICKWTVLSNMRVVYWYATCGVAGLSRADLAGQRQHVHGTPVSTSATYQSLPSSSRCPPVLWYT